MKKLFLLAVLALTISSNLLAQELKDPKAIYDRYSEVIGVNEFNKSSDSNSAMMDMELKAPGVTMQMTVISEKPNKYRGEIKAQGMEITVVGDDQVAYVTTQGQTQKITDPVQIKQMLPMTDITKDIVPAISEGVEVTYKGVEGKGKKACDLVEIPSETGNTIVYFNQESGLIDKTVTEIAGADGMTVVVRYSDYKQFADGELLLPSKLITEAAGANVTITINEIVANYPTAAWMFAAPEAK